MNTLVKVIIGLSALVVATILVFTKMSYVDSGYNQFLEQPLATEQGQSALDFDALIESGAISTEQLSLGIVAELKDADGNVILDSSGLKSETQFTGDATTIGYQTLSTDSTWTDIAGSSISFTADRRIAMLVFFTVDTSITSMSNGDDLQVQVKLFIDDVEKGGVVRQASLDANGERGEAIHTQSYPFLNFFNAGPHTLKLKWKKLQISGTTGTAVFLSGDLNYIIFGK